MPSLSQGFLASLVLPMSSIRGRPALRRWVIPERASAGSMARLIGRLCGSSLRFCVEINHAAIKILSRRAVGLIGAQGFADLVAYGADDIALGCMNREVQAMIGSDVRHWHFSERAAIRSLVNPIWYNYGTRCLRWQAKRMLSDATLPSNEDQGAMPAKSPIGSLPCLVRTKLGPGGGSTKSKSPEARARGLFLFSGREFGNRRFTLTGAGAGLGKGRGDLVAVRRGWPPENCLEVGPSQRATGAGRMTPAEIRHLPAGVRAIFRAGARRSESLVAAQAAAIEPSFHAVAIAQVRRSQ
jgi:hypothetical protein